MKKNRIKLILGMAFMGCLLTACKKEAASPEEQPSQKEQEIQDEQEKQTEDAGIAFLLYGTEKDGSYNEDIYKGIELYALGAGKTYAEYRVEEDSEAVMEAAIEEAVSKNAEIIVCGGYTFGETVLSHREQYQDVSFLLIDGVFENEGEEPENLPKNVHCISFKEEESGYLAGYAAVLEGYRELGVIGGEKLPSVENYISGFLQGIYDAAKAVGTEDVVVNCWYAETFEADPAVEEKAEAWYEDGTEVIFACGGALYQSVLKAAEEKEGWVIGVDVDQSGISERFLTSAIKDTSKAVITALDNYYAAGKHWPDELAGKELQYGIKEECTGIPLENTSWRFQNITTDEIYEIIGKIKSGELPIFEVVEDASFTSLQLNVEKAGES